MEEDNWMVVPATVSVNYCIYYSVTKVFDRYISNDLKLGNLKVNCLLLKFYCKLRKNVSEPQT